MAITKASLTGMFRSPQAVFFSLFFPIVLIVIFGALSQRGGISVDVAFDKNTDTTNRLYQTLVHVPVLHTEKGTEEELADKLKKGRITALISIKNTPDANPEHPYAIHLKTTSASKKDLPVLNSILQSVINNQSRQLITMEEVPGRSYT